MAERSRLNRAAARKVRNFACYLRERGLNIEKVFLFGSHAQRMNRTWSDIDVCIISPQFTDGFDSWAYLWQSRRPEDVDAMIAPVGFHPDDFVDEEPLVAEIKLTGVEIEI